MIQVYQEAPEISGAEADAIASGYLRGFACGMRDAEAGRELPLDEISEIEGFDAGYTDGHRNGRIRLA